MVDVTDATFDNDVMQASRSAAVVVDLWAPWCAPCKTLGPILEKVIDETKGQVVLAKVNVDENPAISQAFKVQSMPAVFALKDGRIVDGFVGAQGEAAVREFVERLLPSDVESEIDILLEAGDEESLRMVLEIDPGHTVAIIKLGEILVRSDRGDEAHDIERRAVDGVIGAQADERGDGHFGGAKRRHDLVLTAHVVGGGQDVAERRAAQRVCGVADIGDLVREIGMAAGDQLEPEGRARRRVVVAQPRRDCVGIDTSNRGNRGPNHRTTTVVPGARREVARRAARWTENRTL